MRHKSKFKTITLYFLALIAFETVSLPLAFAHGGMTGNSHFLPWVTGRWGIGWFGLILTLLFWILVIWGSPANHSGAVQPFSESMPADGRKLPASFC